MLLEGKIAAITGGSAGIGLGIAEAYVREGARVALFARNPTKGAAAVEQLGGSEKARFYPGDAMDQSSVEGFVADVINDFGRVDIMVNNAGGAGVLQPVVDLPDEAFDECLRWNLYSTFWAMRASMKDMLTRKWGRVINISSLEGKVGKPVLGAYVASKHAINGLTKSAAGEVGTEGITVNAICPGLVITDIVRENGPKTAEAMGMTLDEMINLFSQESAIKRPNTVEEVAAAAVLLASDAGGGITGTLLSVDGGTSPY